MGHAVLQSDSMPLLDKRSQERGFSPCLARILKEEKRQGTDGAGPGAATCINKTKVQGSSKIPGQETAEPTLPPGNSPSGAQLSSCSVCGRAGFECRAGTGLCPLKQGPSPSFHLSSCCLPASGMHCSRKELLPDTVSSRELLLMKKELFPPLIPRPH